MLRKKPQLFTTMLVGPAGCGKTSFINSLFDQQLVEISDSHKQEAFNVYVSDVDMEGLRRKISIVDTPGLGASMNDSYVHDSIVIYLRKQFCKFLTEETKINRNPNAEDTRVHALIYFIPSRCGGLRLADIKLLKKVDKLVNLILVIAKADSLTLNELKTFKENVKDQVRRHDIRIFNFDKENLNDADVGFELQNKQPFTIISFDSLKPEVNNRIYPWGTPGTMNVDHCDFKILREIILSSYTDVLIEETSEELYENYRTEVLSTLLPNDAVVYE
ncbi:hypothetical protein VCUG_00258 [Vavraia culicis subsp. floridensis]|uniref:Septin-type G domain-containing protein n=1 Tax=Vavraia culicis (isolate floridensis) TaxID=948595 RepID=L2GXX6_VAVCU|nr:uncharacterized protein VCUG_00258 [Vavraia culicis subsp. floridensis]ELA48217.1 hypothetical protein VCUG_00258 [Vavraia culicis subsp. floridensis]